MAASGNLAVTAIGDLRQSAGTAINVAGTAVFSTVAPVSGQPQGDITLFSFSNDFTGAVSAIGNNVAVADINALALGNIRATNLTVGAGGPVSILGILDVIGATTFVSPPPPEIIQAAIDPCSLSPCVLADPLGPLPDVLRFNARNVGIAGERGDADSNVAMLSIIREGGGSARSRNQLLPAGKAGELDPTTIVYSSTGDWELW